MTVSLSPPGAPGSPASRAPEPPVPTTARSQYRLDIQGLRALAVGVVIAFHAGVPGLAGGYVGVDVFFVISGYLITGHLLRIDRTHPGRELRSFYGRRILRLLPTASVVTVATLLLARVILPPLEFAGVGRAGRASALYVINLLLASDNTAYLSDSAPSPFQQFWSLAVEEQFYLFWPLTLLVILILTRGRRVWLAATVALLAVLSLASCVYLTAHQQPLAFFLLPPRAWEFGLGALLAILPGRLRSLSAASGTALTWLGLAAIVAAATTFDARTPFPGTAALLPTLGTAAVIAGGSAPAAAWSALPLLKSRIPQWLGKVSYSLYLWHWPILVIPALDRSQPLSVPVRFGLVGVTLVVSAATYRWVEAPLRGARVLTSRPARPFVLAAALTVLGVVAAALVGTTPSLSTASSLPTWPAGAATSTAPGPSVVGRNLTPSLTAAKADLPHLPKPTCIADYLVTVATPCSFGDPAGTRTVVLLGDSHAEQWLPAVDVAARDAHERLVVLLKVSCPVLEVDVFNAKLGRTYTECTAWRGSALQAISRMRPASVLIGHYAGERLASDVADPDRRWADGLGQLLKRLPAGTHATLISDGPAWKTSPVTCLSAHLTDAGACSAAASRVVHQSQLSAEATTARQQGASVLDMGAQLCPSGTCPAVLWNVLVYRDVNHVTASLASRFAPLFEATLTG